MAFVSNSALGLIEIGAFTPALVALDALEKAADVRLVQAELNDQNGALIKIAGDAAPVRAAVSAAEQVARDMKASIVTSVINAPANGVWQTAVAPPEFNPLLDAYVVYNPRTATESNPSEKNVSEAFALGLIETQGLTAVLEALDTAAKAANVEVVGKEKLGGGYVTVIIKGDVAAVQAAVAAGRSRVETLNLGKVVATHVIARPSPAVLSLLPKV
jgi:microcompartment protein CcmL/EutN